MSEIGVGFDALAEGARRLDDAADSIAGRVASAKSRVEELLSSGWTGGAATAFGSEFTTWATAADDAVAVLRRLVSAVRTTASDFAQTEVEATAASQALGSSLPSLGIAAIMGGGS